MQAKEGCVGILEEDSWLEKELSIAKLSIRAIIVVYIDEANVVKGNRELSYEYIDESSEAFDVLFSCEIDFFSCYYLLTCCPKVEFIV